MRLRGVAITAALALTGGVAMAAWIAKLVAHRGGDHTGLLIGMFVMGAGGGVLLAIFGWAVMLALGPEPPRLPLRAGEEILFTRHANQFGGFFWSGYLTFTTQRLLFHARKMSFRREPYAIELASIRGARPIAYSYVQLALDDGQPSFVVEDRYDLIRLIETLAPLPESERTAAYAAWCESPPPYPATDGGAT
jgi:hypothetical protein